MNHCPNCGKEISEFAAKCPHCQFHINESNTDQHEVASNSAYAKNNLTASNIPLKYQLIWSVVSAVFSVAAIIIARIFEIKIFDAKLGDVAVTVIQSAIKYREITVMVIISIIISIGAIIAFWLIYSVVRQMELSFGIVFIIMSILSGILFDILFPTPQDYIADESFMSTAIVISNGLPYYCAIIISGCVSVSIYGVLKWGKTKGIVNTFIAFVFALLLLGFKAKMLVGFGFGIGFVYSIPAALLTFIMMLLLLFIENMIYAKTSKNKAGEVRI